MTFIFCKCRHPFNLICHTKKFQSCNHTNPLVLMKIFQVFMSIHGHGTQLLKTPISSLNALLKGKMNDYVISWLGYLGLSRQTRITKVHFSSHQPKFKQFLPIWPHSHSYSQPIRIVWFLQFGAKFMHIKNQCYTSI